MIDGAPNAYGLTEGTATKTYSIANYQGVPSALYDKFASEPLIPVWALDLYDIVLGPAFILLGLALLLGLASRIALFGMGLLYTSLTFGLILIKQSDGVAWLAIHVLMVVAALLLAKHNRLTLLKSGSLPLGSTPMETKFPTLSRRDFLQNPASVPVLLWVPRR